MSKTELDLFQEMVRSIEDNETRQKNSESSDSLDSLPSEFEKEIVEIAREKRKKLRKTKKSKKRIQSETFELSEPATIAKEEIVEPDKIVTQFETPKLPTKKKKRKLNIGF